MKKFRVLCRFIYRSGYFCLNFPKVEEPKTCLTLYRTKRKQVFVRLVNSNSLSLYYINSWWTPKTVFNFQGSWRLSGRDTGLHRNHHFQTCHLSNYTVTKVGNKKIHSLIRSAHNVWEIGYTSFLFFSSFVTGFGFICIYGRKQRRESFVN